ncbi:MAG: GTP 3',8-cyclase MoaA [Candidatus Hydrothermarchaeaceae archaeon]
MIRDRFRRPLTSVRISVTRRCNLNCIYCHKEGIRESKSEMTPGEIERIIGICTGFGIKKVKITGGEPLMRSDICKIVLGISSIDGVEEVSMTSNGTMLADYASCLKRSGLDRINISLDTLKPDVFSYITSGGELEQALAGVESAIDAGFRPVKLNVVVMRGINDNEIEEIMRRYSMDGVVVQLIELMETGNGFFKEHFFSLNEFEDILKKSAEEVTVRRFMQGRRKYYINSGQVEVVRPMHNTEFGARCTRMRITPDGKFKPCLMRSDNHVDFLSSMRAGATDLELRQLFKEALDNREPYFKKK